MLDFLSYLFSAYYERRLEDLSSYRLCRPIAKYPEYKGEAIIEVSDDVYEVTFNKDVNVMNTVNTATTMCTCHEGETAKMCKHLHYVFTLRKASTAAPSNYLNDFKGLIHRVNSTSHNAGHKAG